MALPVREVTYPAALRNQDNGLLPQSILRSTNGLAGGPAVLLVEPATRGWRAMTAAAQKAGHTLKSVSSYRPYADQERIFRERYVNNYDTGNERRFWPGHGYWWRRDGVAAAAVPGTSNHGWGLAVDIGEERDGDTGTESIDANTVQWLIDHAHIYGFSAEVQSEAWHWRWFAGDDIPAAVIEFEGGGTVQPQRAEDDDVFTYEYDKDGTGPVGNLLVLVSGGKQVRLNGAQVLANRRAADQTHLGSIDTATYDRMGKAFGPVIGV